ncbi:Uncharacterised protein [Raoultella ornithinolytica]|nr:Uncharacterised protein [Raoultella ornithinolytica]
MPPSCRPNYLGRASRDTSNYRSVGYVSSPRSLTGVSSRGFALLPPSCRPNYLGRASRHTSNYRGVGYVSSPRSLTGVSSRGFALLPPSCRPNYLGRASRDTSNYRSVGSVNLARFTRYGSSRLEPSVARLSSTSCARRASVRAYFWLSATSTLIAPLAINENSSLLASASS